MSILRAIGLFLKDLLRLLTGIGSGRWGSRAIGMFVGMVTTALGGMAIKLLQFFGLTLGINTFLTPAILPYIVGPLTGLPPEWQAFLSLARVDRATTILVSAMAIATAQRIRLKPQNPSLWT